MLSLILIIYIYSFYSKTENSKVILRVVFLHLILTLLFMTRTLDTMPGDGVYVQSIVTGSNLHVTYHMVFLQFVSLIIITVKLAINMYRNKNRAPSIGNYFFMQLLKMMDLTQIPLLGYLLAYIHEILYTNVPYILPEPDIWEVKEKLNNDMHHTIRTMYGLIRHLETASKDVIIVSRNGALNIEIPKNSKLSEEEISKLGSRVEVAERLFSSKREEYRGLVTRDISLNNGVFSQTFSSHLTLLDSRYRNVVREE